MLVISTVLCLFGFILFGSLWAFWIWLFFFPLKFRKFSSIICSNKFSASFFSFWDSCIVNVSSLDVVFEILQFHLKIFSHFVALSGWVPLLYFPTHWSILLIGLLLNLSFVCYFFMFSVFVEVLTVFIHCCPKLGEQFCDYYILNYLLFGHSVVSNSLWPHGLQHTRLPFIISQSF